MMPNVDAELEEVPCKTNPLGVKGSVNPALSARRRHVINALLDALAPPGVAHIDMPATPMRVWQSIAQAQSAPASVGSASV
jgi:aerobic carbon-monoxide dehydrogenase large subunit